MFSIWSVEGDCCYIASSLSKSEKKTRTIYNNYLRKPKTYIQQETELSYSKKKAKNTVQNFTPAIVVVAALVHHIHLLGVFH